MSEFPLAQSPQQPSIGRLSAITTILREDLTVLGRVFRAQAQGLVPMELPQDNRKLPIPDVATAWDIVDALLHGTVPDSPMTCRQVVLTLRRWLEDVPFPHDVNLELVDFANLLIGHLQNPEVRARYGCHGDYALDVVKAAKTFGMHVYTMEHYLDFPLNLKTAETLFAAGQYSAESVTLTSRPHVSGSLSFPQDLLLVRVYPCEDEETASAFHFSMHEAGHAYQRHSRTQYAGWQWYLTGLPFLDHVARSLGLSIWTPIELGSQGPRRSP